MSSRAELKRALQQAAPDDRDALFRNGIAALNQGLEAEVRDRLEPLLGDSCRDARLWQLLGLARRALHDSAAAHDAFTRAAALAPADPLIAHSQARTALEAGFPAVRLFERAARLAPTDGTVLLGRAAAQMAEGDGAGALAALERVLAANPLWIDGHLTFVRIQAMLHPSASPGADPRRTLRAALARLPRDSSLRLALMRSHSDAKDYAGALRALDEARHALGEQPGFATAQAIFRGESGDAQAAQAMFERLPPPTNGDEALWPVRNLIRLKRLDEAARLAERGFGGAADMPLWPYRALLWRALGDRRWHWLEGDPRLIGCYAIDAGDLGTLAECLRRLHRAAGQPLEQSVRGGTQTDGMLFARAEPEIRRLAESIADAVRAHVAQLPPPDPEHPTLGTAREPIRFAGAWSVRLSGSGRHVDHVHTHGWLSSAFYVALPEDIGGAEDEHGCLAFGECRDLLPDLGAFHVIRPVPGQLVLFPATMWHGTRAFTAGERLTVAFDVAPPRGEA